VNNLEGAAPTGGSGGSRIILPLLFGAVIALVAATVVLFIQLDHVRTDLAKQREAMLSEIANLKEASSVSTATSRRHVDALREELEAARRQAAMAVGQAKTEAMAKAEQLARQLAEEQRRQHQQVASELSEVKQTTTATTAKLGEVSTEVSTVKGEVASTKSELEKTIADLKRMTGDLGVMSGLIATNSKELAALKALGERNYFEFDLKKTKAPQRIGDISVLLKRTDPKRNRYTVEVIADDKRVEKKDKNINEPVQFYVSKARQPYELVVNEVRKDQIIGYLSTPKVQAGRP
jgi:chromosome segregation ATPase